MLLPTEHPVVTNHTQQLLATVSSSGRAKLEKEIAILKKELSPKPTWKEYEVSNLTKSMLTLSQPVLARYLR
jgi:hypothetical protein